jgi:hypothetical protein
MNIKVRPSSETVVVDEEIQDQRHRDPRDRQVGRQDDLVILEGVQVHYSPPSRTINSRYSGDSIMVIVLER